MARSAFVGGLVLVSCALGFALGYNVREHAPAAAQAATHVHGPARSGCPFEAPPELAASLSDLKCPGKSCEHRPLLECHCEEAHSVKMLARSMFARGVSARAIRDEVEILLKQ